MKILIAHVAIGFSLLITSPTFTYTVKSGDTVSKIAERQEPESNVESSQLPTVKISDYERDLLARLVRAEAQGESFEGKVAVAEVVLNRVESEGFPDSISEVVYQKGQFSPVNNGSINRPADEESHKAVSKALAGSSLVGDALFFYNPKTATSKWLDSRETAVVIGNHTFKY